MRAAAIAAGALMLVAVWAFVFLAPMPALDPAEATRVFDIRGGLVAAIGPERRVAVPLDTLPGYLPAAVVAVEDRHFYRHFGVDPVGVLRAVWRNLRAGRVVEGGSTITQQLARNLFLGRERTFTRKLRELLWTFKLEATLSKEEILERYLNTVYFGHGSYGVEVAAGTYFGKRAAELTLAEAALLAGLPRGPERYSPYRNPELALARRRTVLEAMVEVGVLDTARAAEADAEPLRLVGLPPSRRLAPYFVDWVVQELLRRRPELAQDLPVAGYRIYTTLDLKMQETAERAVAERLVAGEPDAQGVVQPQVALVAVDPATGAVRALVGGRSYPQTQLNRAVPPLGDYRGMRRQPGSAFKPILYAAVIDRGFAPTARMACEPVTFRGAADRPYSPTDFGPEPYHLAELTVREALAVSCNVAAVRWAARLGPATVVEYARRLGVQGPLGADLSLALGSYEVSPLEMAAAMATLAGGGVYHEPFGLLRVEDRRGRMLHRHSGRARVALPAAVAYVTADLMRSVLRPGGTGARIGGMLGRPAAAKTGTVADTRGRVVDAWFVGFSPELAVAVWVGRDRPGELPGGGAALAGPIWADFLSRALAGRPAGEFAVPAGVVRVKLCRETGLAAGPYCPGEEEVFLAGSEPPPCPGHLPFPEEEPHPREGDEPADDGGQRRPLTQDQHAQQHTSGDLLGGDQVHLGGRSMAERGVVEGVPEGGGAERQEQQGEQGGAQGSGAGEPRQGQGGEEEGGGQVDTEAVSVQGVAIPLAASGEGVDGVEQAGQQGQQVTEEHPGRKRGFEPGHDRHPEQGQGHAGVAGGGEGLCQDPAREESDEDTGEVDEHEGVGDAGEPQRGDVEEEVQGGDGAVDDQGQRRPDAQGLPTQAGPAPHQQRAQQHAAGGHLGGTERGGQPRQHRGRGEAGGGHGGQGKPASFHSGVSGISSSTSETVLS